MEVAVRRTWRACPCGSGTPVRRLRPCSSQRKEPAISLYCFTVTFMSLFTPAGTNYIPVLDLAAATSWYEQKFGLRQRPTKFDDGQRGVELWLADELYFVLGPGNVPHYEETPMLYTTSFDQARTYLRKRGVSLGDICTDRQGTRFFEIRDLENNLIEIVQES
jgi:catechol 2,3-dioxygenase-like lactoylglutathione lyase family enzyme